MSDALAAVGVRASDVLSLDRLILVEGESDAQILGEWFGELATSKRADFITPGLGGDAAWRIDLVEEVLASADAIARPLLFIRDRDEMADRECARLEASGIVRVLEKREIENYLLDPDAITGCLSELTGEQVHVREIKAAMGEAADDLKQVVVLKRVVATLRPVRLADRAAVGRMLDSGPSRSALEDHVQARISEVEQAARDVGRLWDQEMALVDAQWSERKLDMAPGEEILCAVFQRYGRSFDKGRDGPRLARRVSPPKELMQLIGDFLADSR